MRRLVAFVVGLATAASGTLAVAAGARGFSFFASEFEPPERTLPAAQAFVATRLPPGLPLDDARRRLQVADLHCPRAPPETGFTCLLDLPVHIGGGLIGEDAWSVRVDPDEAGRVLAATVDHRIIGTGPPNPQ